MTKRLWDKGQALNERMHKLSVGNDPEIDQALVAYDALGSAAHAKMLSKIAFLSEEDGKKLRSALYKIYCSGIDGTFKIPPELEDVHTAIENILTQEVGEAGSRIHTGRSRNDQVILAMRLYLRELTLLWLEQLASFAQLVSKRFDEENSTPMPGYTHMQPAMPSSVGMWLHAWYEWSLSLIRDGLSVLELINLNPLGSAAGFGTPLGLDRKYVASLLGFTSVQRSFIDVNNSRGRAEGKVLRFSVDIAALFEKLACDIVLYCSKEFGFFSFSPAFTTGSSIMPQKKNPDLVELMRGKAAKMRGALAELTWVTAKLPSSYHRDFQYTKEPVVRSALEMNAVFEMAALIIENLQFSKERLSSAMYPELYATYAAYRQVKEGKPFRDAYKDTAESSGASSAGLSEYASEFAIVQGEVMSGMNEARSEFADLTQKVESWKERIEAVKEEIWKD